MKEVKTFVASSKLGPIYGAVGPNGLLALVIPQKGEKEFKERLEKRAPGSALIQVEPEDIPAGRQLLEYLRGKRKKFTVRLDLSGLPPFHQLALFAVKDIPYGQTRTYGQIAAQVGRPKACRAVGQANGANPMPLFIPCHRVVGTGGALTGFGSGLDTKRALLQMEKEGGTLL